MPEYLAPGVFVEEVSSRQKSIEGVGTSVAGIVGPTRFGPVRGKPLLCTSYLDYERYFGDARNLQLGGPNAAPTVNHTPYAARAFFDNGGKQLFVARVVNGGGGQATATQLGTAKFGLKSFAVGTGQNQATLTLRARFPGAAGNLDLVFTPRTAENLVTAAMIDAGTVKEGDGILVTTSDVAQARVVAGQGGPAFAYPLKSLVGTATVKVPDPNKPTEFQWDFVPTSRLVVVDKNDKVYQDTPAALAITGLKPDAKDSLSGIRFRSDAAAVVGGAYSIDLDDRVAALLPDGALAGRGALLVGTLEAGKGSLLLAKDANGLAKDVTLPLAVLARADARDPAKVWRREYDVTAELGGEVLFEYGTISPDGASPHFLTRRMPAKPQRLADDIVQPAAAAVEGPAQTEAAMVAALEGAFDKAALAPASKAIAPRRILKLAGGTDGDVPDAADFRGDQDEQRGSTGFAALEDVDEISIVLAPAAATLDRPTYRKVLAEMQAHLRRMRYRVGIIDSQRNMTISEVRDFRADISDDRLALYYPWVRAGGLTGEWDEIQLPPSGHVAGLYAATDVRRGVHKAPANEVIIGAIGLEANINQYQQELLNPLGINCLRFFPNRGYRVWGGRTLADDPEWKYVNVRRYFLFLEKSIERATGWAVFEPNGEDLWANVRATVDDFLYNEWFNRHLLGATPEQAYFVRCDRSTMTQNDLDNGRLVCLIGVAPLRPAEFVIFRIGQKTADAR